MSLLYMDGFDEQDYARDGWVNNTSVFNSYQTGRFGGSAARVTNNSSGYLGYTLPTAKTTLYVGFAARFVAMGISSSYVFGFNFTDPSGAIHIGFGLNSSGYLEVRRGGWRSDQVLLFTGTTLLSLNTWYYIEIQMTIDHTAGVVNLRLNGASQGSFTGQTNNAGSSTYTVQTVRLSGCFGYVDIDDLYICDSLGTVNNTFAGDCRVETLVPNGNGAASTWVGSDGNSVDNYLLVDEVPPSTADYVGSATVGAYDEYTFTDVVGLSVYGVMPRAVAQKTDTGTRGMALVARPGTTNHDGASQALGATAWNGFSQIWETNPDTSVAWTPTDLNAAQFGVKVSA